MSIWNSFKKKIEDTWEVADFWDKDENAQQVQARKPQEPTYTPPTNNGGLRVTNTPVAQQLTVEQPTQRKKPNVTVDNTYKMRELTLPTYTAPTTVRGVINERLNQGKSWEEIAGETGLSVQEVAGSSQATRPNYGIARMEKPQQSNWNKVADTIWDANTEADKWRRQQGNDKPGAEQKPLTLENPGNAVSETVGAIPRMANTLGNQIVEYGYTTQQQFAAQELTKASNNYIFARQNGNPQMIATAKAKLDNASQRVSDIKQQIGFVKEGYNDSGGLFNAGTMYNKQDSYEGGFQGVKKIAGNTVEGMTDAATFGLASLGAKQIFKKGFKTALKEGRGIIGKNVGLNFVQGGSAVYGQGGSNLDALTGAGLNATLGTIADLGLASIGSKFYSAKNKIGQILAKDVPDTPVNRLSKHAINSLENNTDGIKPNGVERAGVFYENGKARPIEIRRLEDGSITIVDGRHTLEYMRKNGIENFEIKDVTDQYRPKAATPITGPENMQRTYLNNKALDTVLTPEEKALRNQLNAKGEFVAPVKAPAELPDSSPLPVQKPNSTKQIGELMNIGRYQKKITEDADKLLSKKYGVDTTTVRRLRNGYGEEQMRSILASTSDATNIRDMNAFAISEARKRYGSPKVANQMSPEELASLEKTAPPTKIESPAENIVPEAKKPVVEVQPEAQPTPTKAPKTQLGKMAETFYEATKGKDIKVGFRALNALGKKVSRQVHDDFAVIGSDFSDVATRVQKFVREYEAEFGRKQMLLDIESGKINLETAGLSLEEAVIMRKAQAEMNYIRRRAGALGRKDIGEGDLGELYIPQQRLGQYEGGNLFEGFRNNKPGSEFKRRNKIELEDLDYAPEVIGQYIVRYGDTKAYKAQRIYNALKRNKPDVDENLVREGADTLIDLQGRMNNLETKIGAYGFGTRKTLSDGNFIDSAAEISGVGRAMGVDQIEVSGVPKGFTNGDKLNSVMIGEQTAGDYLGFNQIRDSVAYGTRHVVEADGDVSAIARSVENRLSTAYNLSDEAIEYAVQGINNMPSNLPRDVMEARVIGTYEMAARQQMMEQGMNVNITNEKMRKIVSNLQNQFFREGSIKQAASAKMVRRTLTTTNAIFRKLNVSSAMNELGDLTKFRALYGKDLNLKPDFNAMKEFGLGEIDPAIAPFLKQIDDGVSKKTVMKQISKMNDKTNLYRFVEHYKAGMVASSAKKHYTKLGITGDELTAKVLKDYREVALPVDAFTKTFLDNIPLYTQYMTWGARNLQAEGRLLTGKIEGGQMANKTQWERIARNAHTNLPAKTVWWLTSNGLKGASILTAFGLTDFTGLSEGDYSGIKEEDKSFFDKVANVTDRSTVLSLINSVYQSMEKEKLANSDKYKDANYNPYEDVNAKDDILKVFTPSFIKNYKGAAEMNSQGYSENKAGRVQYEAPTDLWNTAKSYVFGKNQTENAREYSGRKNIVDRVSEGQNPFTAIRDMALEQVNVQDTDYNRPLNDDYTKAYIEIEKDAKTAMLEGGRAYNDFADDLRDNQPEKYDEYIASLDGNHVNPEFWKTIMGDDPEDMTVFKMIGDRKKQRAKDLGTAYDPMYDLPDDQAQAVLQQKSTATGEDIALRNALYKEQWYKDYQERVKEYYNNKAETGDSDYEQTERVVDWYNLNDSYNGLKTLRQDDGSPPEWSNDYPIVYQQKVINDTFGFDSDESKNFFKAYGDAYKEEKAGYDAENLVLINQMREIEGFPPLSKQAYSQATAIKNTDDDDSGSSKYGSSSKSGSTTVSVKRGSYGQKKALKLPSAKIKIAKVKINRSKKPTTVKLKRNKKYA